MKRKMKNRTAHRRLLERRRRTIRVQRGSGNGDGITSVEQWINAVKATKPFVNKSGYVLGDLMDSELTLPSQTDYIYAFDLNKGEDPENKVDIRQEGAAIRNFLNDSLTRLPHISPKEFQEYITSVRRSEIGDAEDIVESMMFMVRLENKIRDLARDSKDTNYPPLEENPDAIADENFYPLFIWALILNTPANMDPGFSTVQGPAPPATQES